MIATKDLVAVNSVLTMDLPNDVNGALSIQYPVGSAGTIVIEASLDNVNYEIVYVTNMNTKVDSVVISAQGMYSCEFLSYKKIRARKTVGVASCIISVGLGAH